MFFEWNTLLSSLTIALIFVLIRSFFEEKKGSSLKSINTLFEVLFLALLIQLANWLFM